MVRALAVLTENLGPTPSTHMVQMEAEMVGSSEDRWFSVRIDTPGLDKPLFTAPILCHDVSDFNHMQLQPHISTRR